MPSFPWVIGSIRTRQHNFEYGPHGPWRNTWSKVLFLTMSVSNRETLFLARILQVWWRIMSIRLILLFSTMFCARILSFWILLCIMSCCIRSWSLSMAMEGIIITHLSFAGLRGLIQIIHRWKSGLKDYASFFLAKFYLVTFKDNVFKLKDFIVFPIWTQ